MANPVLARQFDPNRLADAEEVALDGPSMTVAGVTRKTAGLLLLTLATATITWDAVEPTGRIPAWYWVALIGTVGLAIAIARRPWWARWFAPVYAVVEGAMLGVLSRHFDALWGGVVGQAVVGTVVTFAVMLTLYGSGIVRVGGRLRRFVIGATAGAFVFYLVAIVATAVTGSGAFFFSSPLALPLSLLMVGLATFNLLIDFDAVDRGVAAGEPAELEWAAAFGLVVTLVWIYLELLRLLAILGGRD
jgi:uncharacterized YccA/Bax inhibitor family protein